MEPRSLTDSLRHLFTRVLFSGEPAVETGVRLRSILVVLLPRRDPLPDARFSP